MEGFVAQPRTPTRGPGLPSTVPWPGATLLGSACTRVLGRRHAPHESRSRWARWRPRVCRSRCGRHTRGRNRRGDDVVPLVFVMCRRGEPARYNPKALRKEAGNQCFTCAKLEGEGGKKLLKCARCAQIFYCSRECQKKDWKRHKATSCLPTK